MKRADVEYNVIVEYWRKLTVRSITTWCINGERTDVEYTDMDSEIKRCAHPHGFIMKRTHVEFLS